MPKNGSQGASHPEAARLLWEDGTHADWVSCCEAHDRKAARATTFEGFRQQVKAKLAVGAEFIVYAMLVWLVKWKHERNKNRYKIVKDAEKNAADEEKVEKSTRLAFDILRKDPAKWLDAMCLLCGTGRKDQNPYGMEHKLHGVGPATASLLLSLVDPEVPFYGEDAVMCAGTHTGAYNVDAYIRFRDRMIQHRKEKGLEGKLTLQQMEEALYAAAHGAPVGGGGAAPPAKRQKRAAE